MQRRRNAADIVRWRQFARKGYSAFASLHCQVCIGVLSVATLSVAARAHAGLNDNVVAQISEEEIVEEKEMAEVTVSGTMAPLTQLQSARFVCVLSRLVCAGGWFCVFYIQVSVYGTGNGCS